MDGGSTSQPGALLPWFILRKQNPSNIPKRFMEKIKMGGNPLRQVVFILEEKIQLPLTSYAYAHGLPWAKLRSRYIIYSSQYRHTNPIYTP